MTERPRRRSDAVLERLTRLHPKLIDLSLGRTEEILARLGNPQRRLPPVIHVAGTNGKGSTIALMRAIATAAGLRVHTYTSPHLVRFHERIALSGVPIEEDALTALLEECETANAGAPITFFEITTAAAFLAFSRAPADLLLLETGLGGRFDSTNVISQPAVTAITPISIDHTQFLGNTLAEIAFEKAGILKPGVAAVIAPQPAEALEVIRTRAAEVGAPLQVAGAAWTVEGIDGALIYRDVEAGLEKKLPLPALPGAHQVINAGTAISALSAWRRNLFGDDFLAAGLISATWPGRLQRLTSGPLPDILAAGGRAGAELWLDGGHNPGAGAALADTLRSWQADGPVTLICAFQENKDVAGFLAPLAGLAAGVIGIDLPGDTPAHPATDIAATAQACGTASDTAPDITAAIRQAAASNAQRVLICGSLYLAGDVLADNG